MRKRIIALLLVAAMAITFLTACGNKDSEVTTDDEKLKVALVLAGGKGDRSFYDSADEGVERAKKELGVETKVYECRNDPQLLKDQMVAASEYADIVAVVGFEFYDIIQEMAKTFEDVKYIYVDSDMEGFDNIYPISYADNEGSYLAGALAAMMTTYGELEGINPDNKTIGMVGGEDIDVIRGFQAGYMAGAEHIDPEIKTEVVFADDFEDPAKGKENATMLYSLGADIVFAVAGKTGEGVIQAAEEHNAFAIGVDSDQRYISPDHIIASVIKECGLSIYETIDAIMKDEVEAGVVQVYDLKRGGLSIGYGTEDMEQIVPDEFMEKVEELKDKIISGEITVPTFEDLKEE